MGFRAQDTLRGPHGGRVAGESRHLAAPCARRGGRDQQPAAQDKRQTLHLVSGKSARLQGRGGGSRRGARARPAGDRLARVSRARRRRWRRRGLWFWALNTSTKDVALSPGFLRCFLPLPWRSLRSWHCISEDLGDIHPTGIVRSGPRLLPGGCCQEGVPILGLGRWMSSTAWHSARSPSASIN